MKATVFLSEEQRVTTLEDIIEILNQANIIYSRRKPDFGIVVGGDGFFSYCGAVKRIPLLFVGIPSYSPIGSKAYLAETYLHDLPRALQRIKEGRFKIVEHKMLKVYLNQDVLDDIFTDVYLERGLDSNCLRYKLMVEGSNFSFVDLAIGNGVIITTPAGSTGYFSYIDKITNGEWLNVNGFTRLNEDEVGICHILPTFTLREGTSLHPLRYRVPYGVTISIKLLRSGDARLYSASYPRRGVRVTVQDIVKIGPSEKVVKLIHLL
ncbi:MAG: hypothetical protein RMJ31_07130 [Nitrososphaerota archaeon]|nr:hypothetical protein [Nitrososphaerota archaeon]